MRTRRQATVQLPPAVIWPHTAGTRLWACWWQVPGARLGFLVGSMAVRALHAESLRAQSPCAVLVVVGFTHKMDLLLLSAPVGFASAVQTVNLMKTSIVVLRELERYAAVPRVAASFPRCPLVDAGR